MGCLQDGPLLDQFLVIFCGININSHRIPCTVTQTSSSCKDLYGEWINIAMRLVFCVQWADNAKSPLSLTCVAAIWQEFLQNVHFNHQKYLEDVYIQAGASFQRYTACIFIIFFPSLSKLLHSTSTPAGLHRRTTFLPDAS